MYLVADLHGHGLLAIHREIGLVGHADHAHADSRLARHHDGPDGQQVRADRRDQHGVDRGHHDGPVGREVVGRGAGRRGEDDAIGAEGGDGLAVDLDGEVGHARDGPLGHHHVVERVPLARRLAAAEELGVHHAAHFDGRRAVAPGLQGGVELGERDFGKKAQRAQVHAEQRSVGVGEGARRGQQRPIAAEDDDQVRLARGHLLALDAVTIRLRCARLLCACSRSRALCALQIRRALAVQNAAPSALAEPRAQLGQHRFQLMLLRLGDNSS